MADWRSPCSHHSATERGYRGHCGSGIDPSGTEGSLRKIFVWYFSDTCFIFAMDLFRYLFDICYVFVHILVWYICNIFGKIFDWNETGGSLLYFPKLMQTYQESSSSSWSRKAATSFKATHISTLISHLNFTSWRPAAASLKSCKPRRPQFPS